MNIHHRVTTQSLRHNSTEVKRKSVALRGVVFSISFCKIGLRRLGRRKLRFY
jgi:hypothetical protein